MLFMNYFMLAQEALNNVQQAMAKTAIYAEEEVKYDENCRYELDASGFRKILGMKDYEYCGAISYEYNETEEEIRIFFDVYKDWATSSRGECVINYDESLWKRQIIIDSRIESDRDKMDRIVDSMDWRYDLIDERLLEDHILVALDGDDMFGIDYTFWMDFSDLLEMYCDDLRLADTARTILVD